MAATLLLADDSVTMQRVVELTFAQEGIRVITASDGHAATACLETDRPDIVLADVGLPGVDVYALAARVRRAPDRSGVPVLLLAGAFEPVDETRARDAGCDGVVVKPFEPRHLVRLVTGLLAGDRPQGLWPAEPAAADPPPAAAPVIEVPEGDLAEVDLAEIDVPDVDVAEVDLPEIDLADAELPPADMPVVGVPDVPEVEVPEVDEPEVDEPEVEAPEVDVPVADVPAVDAPMAALAAFEFVLDRDADDLDEAFARLDTPVEAASPAPVAAPPVADAAVAEEVAVDIEAVIESDIEAEALEWDLPATVPVIDLAEGDVAADLPVFAPLAPDEITDPPDLSAPSDLPSAPSAPSDPAKPAPPSLVAAFAALLAAEQAQGAARAVPAMPEAALEEVVRRVVARLTDDVVRNLVLETAERFIREEMDRLRP